MPDYPDTIIGSLPGPDDEIVIESPPPSLPLEIIGNLPPPPPRGEIHRITDTNFTPDGVIILCSCGWSTGFLNDSGTAEFVWLQHIPE